MEFLDGTIIVTALPAMAASFGTEAVTLHAGITAYLLTVAVFILPGGWAAERFGPRRVFSAAIATFTLGSILCGLASSAEAFVAARVLQGVGGAMMVPVGRLVVLRTTAKPDLMRAIALLTWPGLTAPLLGPPLGGFIAMHLSWWWIFLINVPLGLAGFALALRLVPPFLATARRPFDWRGFGLGAVFLLCLTLAMDLLAGAGAPWPGILLLGAGAAVSGLLLLRHVRRHEHPLLDPAPFAVPSFRAVMTTGTAARLLISTMPFLLPLLFQLGFGLDPFRAGLLVLALFVGNLGIKPFTSAVLRRWGFRTVLAGNGLVQAVTMFGCAQLTPGTPVVAVVLLLVISGASRSLQFTALGTLAFADVPERWMAGANTVFSLAFQLSLGLGVALGAVTLRATGSVLVAGGPPSLAAFHATFGVLAVLMLLTSWAGLRLAEEAGSVVSGHSAALR